MKKNLKIITVLVVLAIISGVAYYTFRKSPTAVSDYKPDYIIEPATIVDEFSEDENEANQKYLDKIIQLEGTVVEIEKGEEDKTTVYLEGSLMGNVSCLFSNSELKDEIKVGDKAIVKGKCSGFILDVVLTKCALVK